MTSSELSAIRVECAEAWGFEPGTINETTWLGYCTPLHAETLYELECDADESDEKPDHILANVPYFVGDANAALTLAKALADEGWEIDMMLRPEGWEASLWKNGQEYIAETAPTFALALSSAFLAVHRSKKA